MTLPCTLSGAGDYEVQVPGGFVALTAGQRPAAVAAERGDRIGTTHHEAGTLWMGDDPTTSVTNPHGRFHAVTNAYALVPAGVAFEPSERHRRLMYGRRELTQLTIRVALVALLAAVALYGIYAIVTNF